MTPCRKLFPSISVTPPWTRPDTLTDGYIYNPSSVRVTGGEP
jgi:hypothetical protein